MSPTSSRRRAGVEAFVVDDEIEVRTAGFHRSRSAAERSAVSSSGLIVPDTNPPPAFDPSDFLPSVMLDKLASGCQWALSLIGRTSSFKDLELEDDPAFRSRHPSNRFVINTIASYDPVRRLFIPATIRCSNRSLLPSVHAPSI